MASPGSGKTEVYLQAIEHALAQGKGGIVLVPEIALTPQTVERFKARFSSGPHQRSWPCCIRISPPASGMTSGTRSGKGARALSIGARSAIFAPLDPLGLVIVDEEHEHTYKQEEAPRYHARDVAIVRGQMENAVVVLGSATPSLESFHNCSKGQIHPARIAGAGGRQENAARPHRRYAASHATRERHAAVFAATQGSHHARLERGEQTILFLNRRGYSTSLQCPRCGFVAGCPNCSLSLTYHRHEQKLCCHICGHQDSADRVPERECRIRPSALRAWARKRSRRPSANFSPMAASNAWTPTR